MRIAQGLVAVLFILSFRAGHAAAQQAESPRREPTPREMAVRMAVYHAAAFGAPALYKADTSTDTLRSVNPDGILSATHRTDDAKTTVAGANMAGKPTISKAEAALIARAPKGYNVATEVDVDGKGADTATNEGFATVVTARQIEGSAGSFGDPSRFLQSLAGVVADNDQRNDFLVRGGSPAENLFVIDNIEVPSINQLALSDTTGGFVSMLDNEAIRQLTVHTDAYDDRFDQRLSSVVEVSTRHAGPVHDMTTSEVGLGGVGGAITRRVGRDGSYFLSVRQSVMQYVTDDIGLNGVPHYRNLFFRAEGRSGEHDTWWGMSLTGVDSLAIRPATVDPWETNPYDIDYSGWRNTSGVNWQHDFSATAFGVLSVANAQQTQGLDEKAQLAENALVYRERTGDGISTVKYDWTWQPDSWITVTAGARAAVDRIDYTVGQPLGLQNPYSTDPAPVDAMQLHRQFAAGQSAGYEQALLRLGHGATLELGARGEQWALGGHAVVTGKALFSMPLLGRLFHVGYAEYQQMPATLYLLSFNNVSTLRPIRSRQLTGGVTLADNTRARVTLEAYQKRAYDYPVASEYPQLSLANIADTFGTAFLMFPMAGSGTGLARGVELTAETHAGAGTLLTGTLTYARSWYAGLDGVMRRGNYDIPLVLNFSGERRLGRSTTLAWKYRRSSGLPYTPDDLALSYAQNRDVYDLTRVNAMRSQRYQRLDLRLEQSYRLGLGTLTWYVGLENALNNNNFYAYLWQPHIGGDSEQTQMTRFPDGGMKYRF
jgi:hypothetical protein